MFGEEGEDDGTGNDDDEVEVFAEGDEPNAGGGLKKMEVGAVVGEEVVPDEPDYPKVEGLECTV